MRTFHLTLALVLAGYAPFASAQPTAAGAHRYPWDNRPAKCFASPEAASFEPCKPRADWPDLFTANMRFQSLLMAAKADDDGFDLVERAANELGRSAQRFPNGEYYFESLHLALTSLLRVHGEQGSALMQKWADAVPTSDIALVALALSRREQAWAARGHGYANTVSPEGWKLYAAKLDEADALLEKAPPALRQTGSWQIARVLVTWENARLKPNRVDVLHAATELWPDAAPLYRIPFEYAEPKYGGSMQYMDAIAQLAAKKGGAALYAQIYARHFSGHGQYTLADSAVNWKLMKQGFRELESRPGMPTRWQFFAKAACQMRDKDEARRLYALQDRTGGASTSTEPDPCREYAMSR